MPGGRAAQAGLSGELSEGRWGLVLPLLVTQQAPGVLDSPPLPRWSTLVSTPPGTHADLGLGRGGLSIPLFLQLAASSAPSAPGRSGKWPGVSGDSTSVSFLHSGLWEWT